MTADTAMTTNKNWVLANQWEDRDESALLLIVCSC